MLRIPAALLVASLASLLCSCAGGAGGGAAVWTDVPELAIAVELYDALPQARAGSGADAVELYWKPDLAEALSSAKTPPALVVGRYLGGSRTRGNFASIEYLLRRGGVNREAFYPELLEAGIVGGRRILLPLSFNLPVIVFARGASSAGDGFTLSLAEMAESASAFNRKEGDSYSRMGFSPRWDPGFLVSALQAGGAGFADGRELSWNERGLASALDEVIGWVSRANGSAALEDDFQFKYLFAPPYRFVREGRALYAAMDSASFFRAPGERRAELDFRWFARGGRVAAEEGIVLAGLVRGARGRKAAEGFLRWLLTPEAQRAVLERTRRARAIDFAFGVAGGFSSLRSVNEEIFPAYYPALVGHAPPAAALVAPATLPEDWPALEAAVVAPWALEASAGAAAPADGNATTVAKALAARIAEYRRRGERR